jgi:hypothetical protein
VALGAGSLALVARAASDVVPLVKPEDKPPAFSVLKQSGTHRMAGGHPEHLV